MASSYGGLDVRYRCSFSDLVNVDLITDIAGSRSDVDEIPGVLTMTISTQAIGGVVFAEVYLYRSASLIDYSNFQVGNSGTIDYADVRIFFFNTYVSISFNNKWVYWYGFGSVEYNIPVAASLKNGGGSSVTLTNIRRLELPDGRDAVFVDYEADGSSVISSLIQQRPLQIYPSQNREMVFTYRQSDDEVDAVYVSEYNKDETEGGQVSSDGLVYFRDVDVSISEDTARDVGFVTRLYKLSELDTGAVEATAIMQQQALERRNMISIRQRLDPRIDQNDKVNIDTIVVGTQREITGSFIVEGRSILIENGNFSLRLNGREVDG